MHLASTTCVFFSPTGTTQSIVRALADGINADNTRYVDLTKQAIREQSLETSDAQLLVVAVPVYMGRVPALVTDWLQTLHAHDTPTVCVAVYGNRAYDDALLELKKTVTATGCLPVAYAAYIGEHSFSNAEEPVAQGRPDAKDLDHAQRLGQKIRAKLEGLADLSAIADIDVPGVYPYRKDSKLWVVDFIAVNDQCIQCGLCAEVCPVGAIDPQNSAAIDQEACITCCACIRRCPQGARSIKPSKVKDAAKKLNANCKEPKQPEYYL